MLLEAVDVAGRTAQAVCTLDQQIRDHGMASFVIGHALQVFSGIQLSVPAFMMSPERSVNKAGALDGEAAHEKHR